MGYTDKALMAHLKSSLHQYLRGDNRRAIVGLTHADVVKHVLTCADLGIPKNAVAVLISQFLTAGLGLMAYYPENGTFGLQGATANDTDRLIAYLIPLLNHELHYRLSVADSVWDIYVFGYLIEGQVLE